MDVALQVAAFKEPGLTETLDAWAAQPVPDGVTISYEAWVTPSGHRERCETWQQAEAHDVFSAVEAPQFKLRTRNAAHDDAVARGVDTIISCDADAPPLSTDTLTNLLEHIDHPWTVAAVANPVAPATKPTGLLSNFGVAAKELVGGMHGQCHALTAGGWRAAGPFSDDVDHTKLNSVWLEEEYRFPHRLRQVGKVAYCLDAPVRNDTRRIDCRWARATRSNEDEFCERRASEETFAPDSLGKY